MAKSPPRSAPRPQRGSPSVERATQLLDFLSTHPGRSFTVSELARALTLSKASCHAIVTTLVDRGYVWRDPARPTYSLGPALVPLGSVAERQLPAVAAARAEAHRLSDRFGVECHVNAPTKTEAIILLNVGVAGPGSLTTEPSQRLPLTPPLGALYVAWESDDVIRAWLAESVGEGPEAERYEAALAAVRQRGLVVVMRTDAWTSLLEAVRDDRARDERSERPPSLDDALTQLRRQHYLADDAQDWPSEGVQFMSAPVFGPDGRVQLGLTLAPRRGTSAEEVPPLADALLASAAAVMAVIGGRRPDAAYLGR